MWMKIYIFLFFISYPVFSTEIELNIDRAAKAWFVVKNSSQVEALDLKSSELNKIKLDAPLWISMDGAVPMILWPVSSNVKNVELNALSYEEAGVERVNVFSDQALSEVVLSLNQINAMIQNRSLDEATRVLDQLQARFPRIAFLDFSRASLLYLRGQNVEALNALERALKVHPQYAPGLELRRELKRGGGA